MQAPSHTETLELAAAVDLLNGDHDNLPAWLRLATLLSRQPDATPAERTQAKLALDNVASAFGESGHLPMALVACKRLMQMGEERSAWASLMGLANAYSKMSTRLDASVRPRTPTPPRPAGSGPAPSQASQSDVRARAISALRKAAARASIGTKARDPLPPVPLFSALMPDAFVKLAQQLTVLELSEQTRIFSAGDPGGALYIIARGIVRIEREDGLVLARLRAGSFFGEMALLSGSKRSAHAIAETPVILLNISKEELEQLSGRDESIATVLAEHARRRLLINVMATSRLFHDLSPSSREELMGRFSFRRYAAGDVLIHDGQPGAELMVILSGRIEVARRQALGSKVMVPIATLGLGDVIGEISLLTDRPTMAVVHALEPAAVLVLAKQDFEAVLMRYPEVRAALRKLVAERIGENVDVSARLPKSAIPRPAEEEEEEVLV